MAQRWYQKSGVQAALVAGIALILGSVLGPYATGVYRENDYRRDEMRRWRFSEPLYRRVPGDVDFIARGLRVDKKQGAGVSTLGPGDGDRFTVELSNLQPVPGSTAEQSRYMVQFAVNGSVD